MLIDNRRKRYDDGLNIVTVWDFIKEYAVMPDVSGDFDIVTGYFTLRALSKLYNEIPSQDNFRIISSELVKLDDNENHIIDLLRGDQSFDTTFDLEQYVHDAKAFLMRDNVSIKAFTNAFCHAKVYIYKSSDAHKDSFYLTGSSNLTDAGLGLKATSNVELTIGEACKQNDSNWRELRDWFDEVWESAVDKIPSDPKNPKSKKITVKEYFIRQIDDFFRKYSPEEIYYKILFELFNADLDLDASIEHQKDMSLLQTSVIWNTLFNYQQKGVISLIKMLRKYNGAILADAVGLGKTFSALGVIKYFQTQNYVTVLICPKKLEQNWTQYLRRHDSRFEADEFDYIVRFHSDFQNERMEKSYDDAKLSWLQSRKKVLIVIDESHNLRNEKSGRYQDLLSTLIQNKPGQENRDVKILMLSATPINTGLMDVKGQFNLIGHGIDDAFNTDDFGVESLRNLFNDAQRKYNNWCENQERTIGSFIDSLPPRFFNLTDKLIVARTRALIEKTLGENLGFPKKEQPVNIYQGVDHFGNYKTTEEIYSAFENLFLAAYQPSLFMTETRKQSLKEAATEWDSDVTREHFLVKMMGILFMKRLESSWHSCLTTIKKVLKVHEDTFALIKNFIENQKDSSIPSSSSFDESEDGDFTNFDFSLRKGTIHLSEMKNIGGFKRAIASDIKKLSAIVDGLEDFKKKYEEKKECDIKLDKLEEILKEREKNKKTLIFTAYSDTAQFVFEELVKRGFTNIAFVSGSITRTFDGYSDSDYQTVLQRFAPYSKLYKERDWRDLYERAGLDRAKYFNDEKSRWEVPFDEWRRLVHCYDTNTESVLNKPINILIATDCLSEGQNLQDADLQVNYDIHWNPVRLIQRFGRIDRIGSPNDTIKCINFWPAKSFEDYLNLESRVTNRMAAMTIVGSETQELNDAYVKMVEDNPLQDKNADRLLKELSNNSISDIESPRTLSLKDFSFELYRQDLIDYFEKNKEVFRRMPNGIFSGFRFENNLFENMTESLVAIIGYPHRDEGSTKPYREIYLMCQPVGATSAMYREINRAEVLGFLRENKEQPRYVPEWIETNDGTRLQKLSSIVKQWLEAQVPQKATAAVLDILKSHKLKPVKTQQKKDDGLLEEKFKIENFDLIVWEYVTVNK